MADIEFVEAEYGDTYVITIKDENGVDANISAYSSGKLLINDLDLSTNKLNATLTGLPSTNSKVNWVMTNGQTNYNGNFVAQIQLSGSGITKNTKMMSVKAHRKLSS